MSAPLRTCYLNRSYLALAEARVSPLDRVFLFGDAVYEVIPVYGSRPFRLRQHLDRLTNSLRGIGMTPPVTHTEWAAICGELISRNAAVEAHLYLSTRGVLPVTRLDGALVGGGVPGPLFERVRAAFMDYTREVSALPML